MFTMIRLGRRLSHIYNGNFPVSQILPTKSLPPGRYRTENEYYRSPLPTPPPPSIKIPSIPGSSKKTKVKKEQDEEDSDTDMQSAHNKEMLERTSQFMSVMYALLLAILGGMCTMFKVNEVKNAPRDLFVSLVSLVGFGWIVFLHYDIIKYKKWATKLIKRNQNNLHSDTSSISSISSRENSVQYDSISVNTTYLFDNVNKLNRSEVDRSKSVESGYRYFQGKYSNDFYLKTGMIVFCFGSIMHLGISIVQQVYFYIHQDQNCQNPFLLTMHSIRMFVSFYQLFIGFKYSNIIINRHKNLARFALMHLIGTSISIWLDTIIDEAIDDYVSRKLALHSNVTYETFGDLFEDYDYPFQKHMMHQQNCSRLAIISSDSMNALPYLYPFTIEFNIAIASVWYMIWANIGKVNDKSLFPSVHKDEFEDDEDREDVHYQRSGLLLNLDCHASNRGLFLGLAVLLVIIITIVIFFSTIKKDIYAHFGVMTYSLQISLLTISCFVVIPIAYVKIRKLDVVTKAHRDNAFTIMDDILIMIPIPFYFVHYTLSIVAGLFTDDKDFETNNILLIGISALMIVQVVLQSPFIVDSIRRCANNPEIRYKKPGRELITLVLILNVTLWILNTFELKSVEVYHATHHYFGEIFSMILSHTTLPLMLFYRFHSSVCLSNIWKYAYQKDE